MKVYSFYPKSRQIFQAVACCAITVFLAINFSSCKKNSYDPEYSKARLNFSIKAGSVSFEWDSVKFTNAAGNNYAVGSLNMFISGIKLTQANGKTFSSGKVFYLDPTQESKSSIFLDSIPPGTYTQVSFYVGLNAATNVSLSLPATTDNINMAWPDAMGGGYHFMKLEGYYLDSAGVKKGYAVHLGKNENLVTVNMNAAMNQHYWNHSYTLQFDVNEVFANPYTYNFNTDNNYTMADSVSMFKIKTNMSDAFSISQTN